MKTDILKKVKDNILSSIETDKQLRDIVDEKIRFYSTSFQIINKDTYQVEIILRKRVRLISVVGMRRTGSTLLYNIIRGLFVLNNYDFYCGSLYGGDAFLNFHNDKKRKFNLIKIHTYDENVKDSSDIIFSTIRDLRDAVASDVRFLHTEGRTVRVKDKAKHLVKLYDFWKDYSDYEFNYEEFKNNEEKVINEIVNIVEDKMQLKFEIKDKDSLLNFVKDINFRSSKGENDIDVDLMRRNQMTTVNGKVGTYNKTLSKKDIKYIEEEYKEWLIEHNYEIK